MEQARAVDVYRARVVELPTYRLQTTLFVVIGLLVSAWIPSREDYDPRYRVLVGSIDGSGEIGVREARTRRAAQRALAEVERILLTSSAEDARIAFALEV